MPIRDEQPPYGTDEKLVEYLARQFRAAKREDENSKQHTVRTIRPNKLTVGRTYYFGGAIAADPDITGEGLYIYTSTGFVFLG